MSEEPGSPEPPPAHQPVELTIVQKSPAWDSLNGVLQERFPRAVDAALKAIKHGPASGSELNLILADDALQRDLNCRYRGIDKSTNVLAFAGLSETEGQLPGGPAILGDIVLAFETCAAEADRQGKRLEDHALHLALHGFLHLLGFTHDKAEAALEMETLECGILASFGIPDPYGERDPAPEDRFHAVPPDRMSATFQSKADG